MDKKAALTSSETQGQSVSKEAVFKISNAERSEAKSGEAEGRSASPWGHYLTGLVLGQSAPTKG